MDKKMRFDIYDNHIESTFAELRSARLNEFMEDTERLERVMKSLARRCYEDGVNEGKELV